MWGEDDPIAEDFGANDKLVDDKPKPRVAGRGEYVLNEAKTGLLVDLPTGLPALAEALAAPGKKRMHDQAMRDARFRGDSPESLRFREEWNAQPSPITGVQKWIKEKAGIEDLTAPDAATRYAGSAARFVGASAVPSAAGIGLANKGAKLATGITEASSAVAGGLGSELGADVAKEFGGNETVGRVVGGLGFGALPIVTQTAAGKGVSAITSRTSKEAQLEAAKGQAGKQIREAVDSYPKSKANLDEAEKLSKDIPGFKPTLAQATRAPGLVALQSSRAHMNPANLTKLTNQVDDNARAIERFAGEKFPEGEAARVTAPARKAYQESVTKLEGAIDDVDNQLGALAERFQYQPNSEIGSRLRELREARKDAVKSVKDAKYREAYDAADKHNVRVDLKDLDAFVKKTVNADPNAFSGDKMPGVFREITNRVAKAEEKHAAPKALDEFMQEDIGKLGATKADTSVSFEEFHSLVRRANREYGSSDATHRYFMAELSKKLDEKMRALESPQYGEVGKKIYEANVFWRDKYNEVFNKNLGGRMARENRFGDSTKDEDIVRALIFRPNQRKGVDDFRAIYGDNDEANRLLQNGVMDIFAKEVVRDGKIKPASVETFMRKYDEALSSVPNIKRQLVDADTLNDALLARQRDLQDRKSALAQTRLAKVANVPANEVDGLVNGALRDPKLMSKLVATAKRQPDAAKALAHVVLKQVERQGDSYKFLADNKKTLKPVLDRLSPGHYDNLDKIARARGINESVEVPHSVHVSGTIKDPVQEGIGTSGRTIFQQLRHIAQGRQSTQSMVFDVGGKYVFKLRQEEAERLMDAALYDPQVAKTLAGTTSAKTVTPSIAKRLTTHLFTLGIRVGTTSNDEE